MSPEDRDRRLVLALEDYHRRRAMGERVDTGEYRPRLSELFDPFLEIVQKGEAFDGASGRPPSESTLPRPFGPYLLEAVLGGGGMGVVYQAFHRELARRVALKVLPRALETTPNSVERFRREARACAQVRHPSVVVIHEAGEIEGLVYYTMELVEGRTLQAHIDERTVPEPETLCARMAEVADALETLHAAGVVHRDVKPSNLIVRPDGRMVLADFGLARTFTAPGLTQTGEVVGTPAYMSPEQLLGRIRDVDARTDVYGLGATLYHALAGSPPFSARESQDIARMILVQRPERLRTRRPGISSRIERVVEKALEKKKSDRYTTAGDLRDDLRRVAAGEEPKGRPVEAWRRVARAVGGHAATAAVAATLLVGAGAWWWTTRPARIGMQFDYGMRAVAKVDGVERGDTGRGELVMVRDLPPGDHEVTLVVNGVDLPARTIHLRPGDDVPLTDEEEFRMGEGDLDDPEALRTRLDSRFYRVLEGWGEYERSRGTLTTPLPFLPRDAVRLDEACHLEIEIPAAKRLAPEYFEPDAYAVVLRSGSQDLFEPLPFELPSGRRWTYDLSAKQRAALAQLTPDAKVSWGLRKRGAPSGALEGEFGTFNLVSEDPSADLEQVEKRLVLEPDRVRRLVRARVLLGHGLPTAAARELLAELPPPEKRSFHEWATLYQALSAVHLEESAERKAANDFLETRRTIGDPQFWSRFPRATRDDLKTSPPARPGK